MRKTFLQTEPAVDSESTNAILQFRNGDLGGLEEQNRRLQTLVCELLLKNQELRLEVRRLHHGKQGDH
jgi:hypothetical protein